MRFFCLALVLLAPAAYADVWCHGAQVIAAPDAGSCPDQLANLQASVTTNSITITWTADATSDPVNVFAVTGTSITPPGCPANSTVADRRVCNARLRMDYMEDGTGAADYGAAIASAGSLTLNTNITDAQDYCIAVARSDLSLGELRPEVETLCVTTAETPTGTDQPEYFASDSGSDLNDGLSWASPVATPSLITASMIQSDDLCLGAGSVFADQRLTGVPNGISGEMVVVGSCYESGGTVYWHEDGPMAFLTTLAQFDGTFDTTCDGATMNCNVGTYDGTQAGSTPVPSSVFAGLVDLGDASQYVHLKYFIVRDSAGRGVDMKLARNVVVEGVETYHNAFNGIISERGSKYVVYKGILSDGDNAGEAAEDQGRLPGDFVAQANMGASTQPSCVKLCIVNNGYSYEGYCGMWGSVVKNCAGEGIGMASTGKLWVEQNIIYDTGVSYYGDHLQGGYIIRNLAAGSGNGSQVNQSGYSLAAEGTAVNRGQGSGSTETIWAWNISVGTALGFGVRNIGAENVTEGYDIWAKFWHNASIRATAAGSDNIIFGASGGIGAVTADTDFVNNVVWADVAANAARVDTSMPTFDYNAWDGLTPDDPDAIGANDVNSSLTWPHTASEYENITYTQAAATWTLADYKPTGGSENAAQVLSVPAWATTDLASSEWDFIRQYDGDGYFMWGAAGCTVNVAASALLTGADCQGLDASPDMGAVQ